MQLPPLIRAKCLACHDPQTHQGGLDLTKRLSALTAKKIDQRVAAGQMPPGAPLSATEKATVRAWTTTLAQQATANNWALQPLRPSAKLDIDGLVRKVLADKGLTMAPPADRRTLLRRVTLDLTGLPPTPEEVAAFVADTKPDAYERVVDRLLASPAYGERWGRHWLDVARYGESHGFERDQIRDNAWRYRDWVIDAFNRDLPYDQFVREQLAGDVLPGATAATITATGFLVGAPWDEVGQSQVSAAMRGRVREEELEEVIGTVGQAFLGLTVQCARCHDHKFDPIPQTDYYRLQAALAGIRHGNRALLSADEQKALDERRAAARQRVAALDQQLVALLQQGQDRALRNHPDLAAAARAIPPPLARWTFDDGLKDSVSGLTLKLEGGAHIEKGRLVLRGMAFAATAALPKTLEAKTLEAWVSLSDLQQRGGGALSVETGGGEIFDSIVFGEQEAGKWIAGSNNFSRTQDAKGPSETAGPGQLVHVAITYTAEGQIQLYRNGQPYGTSYRPGPTVAFPQQGARLLLGRRHTGGGNAYFQGEIDEARVYGRALTADEIRRSFAGGAPIVSETEALAALTPAEQAERERLLAQRRQQLALIDTAPAQVYAVVPRAPEPIHLLHRGDIDQPGELMVPGALSAIPALPATFGLAADAPEAERRRRLAEWIVDPRNPLTARVIVNRLWHYHFGRGLVGTPSDFGVNGEPCSHPELLDALATDLIRGGWKLKRLQRQIVLSATYRQSGRFDPKAAKVDSDNWLLWRFAPRRLEAEAVRDTMLAVSGQLNPQRGGPSFRPFNLVINNSHFYTMTDPIGPEYNRRSIYRINVQSARPPLLEALDCPDPSTKTPRRTTTVTPLQALELMNDSFVLRQSRELAQRVEREVGNAPLAQVRQVYRRALGRSPSPPEEKEALAFVGREGLDSLCWALFNASEFLYLR